MSAIKQEIDIKANVTGLESARKAKQEIQGLKDIAGEAQKGGAPSSDVTKISGMQKQINMVRQMHQITSKMTKEANQGAMLGSNQYVKNLEKSIKAYKKLSDISEDISDNTGAGIGGGQGAGGGKGAGGGLLGGIGTGAKAIGNLSQDNLIGGAMSGLQGIGGGLQDKGGKLGKLGKGLATAGLIAGATTALFSLVSGGAERRADLGLGLERREGKSMDKGQLGQIMQLANFNNLDQAGIYRAMDTYMTVSGRGGLRDQDYATMASMQGKNVNPEVAGRLMGMARISGTDFSAREMEKMGTAGGYGKRLDVFTQGIDELTSSLQNVGELVAPERLGQVISDLGKKGDALRGQSGISTARSLNQAITGGTSLQTPQQAMMFRALSKGGSLGYSEVMDRMSKGVGGAGNIEDILGYMSDSGMDLEGQISLLMGMGLSRAQAKALLGGDAKAIEGAKGNITARTKSSHVTAKQSQREMGVGVSVGTKLRNVGKNVIDKARGVLPWNVPTLDKQVEGNDSEYTEQELQDLKMKREWQEASPAERQKMIEESNKLIAKNREQDEQIIVNMFINGSVNKAKVTTKKVKKNQ